jgi:ethanolamine utilization protein EutN
MILARVTGSVVSTIHHPIVDGRKLLLAERLDEMVLDEGNGARQILDDSNAPVRSIVVGIVDAVEL